MYRVRGDERVIRFNPWIFAKYPEDSFANTVPHEVAHYVADCCYGLRRIKPHGAEWKSIMQLFGADSRATSRYSLEGIPQRRMTRFAYHCACKIHELSSQRHHRIRRGVAEYRCRSCGSLLMGQAST
jgi:SprT protein